MAEIAAPIMRMGQDLLITLQPDLDDLSVESIEQEITSEVARILARGFTLLDPSEYGKLRDFYDKVATTDRQQVVLTAQHTAGN